MARNNHVWVKGDITGDIYFDIFKLDNKDVQFLRLYLMVKGVKGANGVRGLRTCVYGPLAELVYGHVRKGSRLGVIGHIQQRTTRQGKMVFEIVATEVEFLRNIDWEAGSAPAGIWYSAACCVHPTGIRTTVVEQSTTVRMPRTMLPLRSQRICLAMNERQEIRIPLSTLVVLASLILLAIGGIASPRNEDGRPLLLLPDVKAVSDYRQLAREADKELRLIDGKITATLGGDVDDLFGQTRRAQDAFEHILRISEELDRQDAPPVLVGLKDDLNQTAVSYLEAARLTLRWLSTPTQANNERAQAKLTEARSSLTELEKSQWLQTDITIENLRQLLHIQTELREQAEIRWRKAQRVLVGLLESFAPEEVDQRLKAGQPLDHLPVDELEQLVRQQVGNRLLQAQSLLKESQNAQRVQNLRDQVEKLAVRTDELQKENKRLQDQAQSIGGRED